MEKGLEQGHELLPTNDEGTMQTSDSEESESTEGQTYPKRQQWSSQLDYVMTMIGCCVGLGNIYRFPYLCYENGGGAFLVPYTIAFFTVAMPLFLLEVTLGQYTKSGSIRAWTIVPGFKGLGFATQVLMLYQNIYYVMVIAWALYYIAVSLTSQLPWTTCDNPWNTPQCFVSGMNISVPKNNCTLFGNSSCQETEVLRPVDSVVEYWERQALQMSSGIEEPGRIVPGMALSLLGAWVFVFLCLCRGVKFSGKVVYFTALFPYVLITIILIRALTFEGAVNGIIFYLKPDFSRLLDARVWIAGGTQVIYSCGLAQGYLISMASFNKFNNQAVRNGIIIVVVNCLTSLYGGFAVFAVLGFMAHEMNVPVKEVVSSGPGLIFLTYPKAVTKMPLAPLWSVLFFLMIFFVGIDSLFVVVEGFLTPIIDKFGRIFNKMNNRTIYVAVHCFIAFLLGMCQVTQGGVYVFRLFDYYSSSGIVLLILAVLEVLCVGWIFGADRYYDVIELMTGRRYSAWFKLCWKFFSPLIMMGILVFELVTFKHLRYDQNYEYPGWATGLGVVLILSSSVCVPLWLIYSMYTAKGTIAQRWSHVTTPVLKKHQVPETWSNADYIREEQGHLEHC